jgi:hypothetical protein
LTQPRDRNSNGWNDEKMKKAWKHFPFKNNLDSSHQQTSTGFRVKGWEKIYQAYGPPKKAGVARLISDKVDFKPTLIK